jgi:hypothetical protein
MRIGELASRIGVSERSLRYSRDVLDDVIAAAADFPK